MRLHLLGVPHTITHPRFSHDAFTNKVRYFGPMMRGLGYEVVHYGVEGSQSGATEDVTLMSEDEFYDLLGHRLEDKQRMHVTDARTDSVLYRTFNARLREQLAKHVRKGDVVLHSLGTGHQGSIGSHDGVDCELGIGYPQSYLPFRIFETAMWMHYHQAKFGRGVTAYEWVIPPYFEADEWPITTKPSTPAYCAFLGRISETKGCHLIVEIAKRMPVMRFVLCGQGDPTPFLVAPNIEYKEPIHGAERAAYLGNAVACLYPSQYAEPGGASALEAILCGTPVITPSYGCFLETVTHGVTGWHCRVLNDWVEAIRRAPLMNRTAIGIEARRRFSLPAVAPLYADAMEMLHGLAMGRDWYTYPARI
jgi:glycosyltransferase involved in cell wall biosynthesis